MADRYSFTGDGDHYEDTGGDWVRYSDYAALKAENERLEQRVRRECADRIEQLEKENADLKTAREYWRSLHDERTRFLGEAVTQLAAKDELLREAEKLLRKISLEYKHTTFGEWPTSGAKMASEFLTKLQSSERPSEDYHPSEDEFRRAADAKNLPYHGPLRPTAPEPDHVVTWIPSESTLEGIASGRLKVGEALSKEPDQQEAVAYLKEDTLKDRDGNRVFHLCSRYDRGAFPVYARPALAGKEGE